MSKISKLIEGAYECRRKKDFEKAAELYDYLSKYFLDRGDQSKYLAFKAHKIECEAMLCKKKREFDSYIEKLREAENIWKNLGNEKNITWCEANIESTFGTTYFKAKKYKESIEHYNRAREAYQKIGMDREAKFCEAYSKMAEAFLLDEADPTTVDLFKSAGDLFREIGLQKKATICEIEAIYHQGAVKFKEGFFQEAKEYFLEAAKRSEILGGHNNIHSFYYEARVHECDYRLAKLNGDFEAAIKALETASQLFQKAKVEEAQFVCMGDLYKLKGFYEKSQGHYENAIEFFQKAQHYFLRASEVSDQYKSRHERSAKYMEALIVSTKADYAMIFENNINKAAELYLRAAQVFREVNDDSTAFFNTKIGELLKSVMEGDTKKIIEILKVFDKHYSLRDVRKLPSLIHNIIGFTSKIVTTLTQQQMRELQEEDAGFNFEARVRELIRCFDGRTVSGSLLGLQENKLILHKYEEVRNVSFTPEDDEVGIVFNDKSPIEIDVLAVRKERGRRFILICECKYRSQKPITIRDLELLERKAKFIEKRYKKIAQLEGELEPKIEEIWFVTTARFEDKCINYAKSHNIRLIDLKKLNNLMEEFRLRKIGPSTSQ